MEGMCAPERSVASVSRYPPPTPASLRRPDTAGPAALPYLCDFENLRICQSEVFQRLVQLGLPFLHGSGACQVRHVSLQGKAFSFCLLHDWTCHM